MRASTCANRASRSRTAISRARATATRTTSNSPATNSPRAQLGFFALEWSSHGFRYGVGVEIDAWLAAGSVVVVSGSRAHLPAALERYPQMCVVHIDAAPHVLAERLATRGRETADEIRARLARSVRWAVPDGIALTAIDNSGTLDDAGRVLVALLEGLARS